MERDRGHERRIPSRRRRVVGVVLGIISSAGAVTACGIAASPPEQPMEPAPRAVIGTNTERVIIPVVGPSEPIDPATWRSSACDGPNLVSNHFGPIRTSELKVEPDSPECVGQVQEHRQGQINFDDSFPGNDVSVSCSPNFPGRGLRIYEEAHSLFEEPQLIRLFDQPACLPQ